MADHTSSQDTNDFDPEAEGAWEVEADPPPWEMNESDPEAEALEIPDEETGPEPAPNAPKSPPAPPTNPPDEEISVPKETVLTEIPDEPEPMDEPEPEVTTPAPAPKPATPEPISPPLPLETEPSPRTKTPVSDQRALGLEEILPGAGRIDTTQLAKNLSDSLTGSMEVVITRALSRFETTANQTLTGLANGLSEAESSLSSTVEEQIKRVSEDMTTKVGLLRDYQENAAKAVEMAVEEFKRTALSVTETIAKQIDQSTSELQQARNDLQQARTESQEAIEKSAQTGQIVTAEIKSAGRQMTLRHWAASFGALTLTMVIGVMLLSRINPGWTMTQQQHDALYMGQHLLTEYWAAEPEKRREIEQVLRLKPPASADSTLRASQ